MSATALRFDICEAYLAIENDYHSGGILQERPSNIRRNMSTDYQLIVRMGFKPSRSFAGWTSLSDEGQEIYILLCERYGFTPPHWDEETQQYYVS